MPDPNPPCPRGPDGRVRVLFVAEAITLAQVVRLVVLARALDRSRFEVHFASASFPDVIFGGTDFVRWPLETVAAKRALARLDRGGRLYGGRTLARYLAADRVVLDRVRPALVVGDLRWSLAVSAPLAGVPHVALANGYMSPHAERDGFPLPDHPVVRLLGERLATQYFPRALPRVFDFFAAPLNRLRRRHGLPPVGSLLEVLTHGDVTLFADPPELVPLRPSTPGHHVAIGAIPWSPPGTLPETWGRDPARRPVYVTLGSSGDARLLPAVLDGLANEAVDVLVATAGRVKTRAIARLRRRHPSVHFAELVSGADAAARAALVVSNGGSTTGYQALTAGCPVLGLPHNLEQHMAMQAMARTGAVRALPTRQATADAVRLTAHAMLNDPSLTRAAAAAKVVFTSADAAANFAAIVDQILARYWTTTPQPYRMRTSVTVPAFNCSQI